MASGLAHYSPEEVTISLAGLFTLKGFRDGTFISIERDVPLFVSRETSDGKVSRTRRASQTVSVTVVLDASSPSNEVLSRFSLFDHSTHTGKFPIFIKDRLGKTVFFCGTAWIENTPKAEFSTDLTGRSWIFKCPSSAVFLGGNMGVSSGFEDIINIGAGLAPSFRKVF